LQLILKENDVRVYKIEIDHGNPITTNKETVEFKRSDASECYEGEK